jgi:hypothetical protein
MRYQFVRNKFDEECFQYFLGDNWSNIDFKYIPSIVNEKINFELIHSWNTLIDGFDKMREYYLKNILIK